MSASYTDLVSSFQQSQDTDELIKRYYLRDLKRVIDHILHLCLLVGKPSLQTNRQFQKLLKHEDFEFHRLDDSGGRFEKHELRRNSRNSILAIILRKIDSTRLLSDKMLMKLVDNIFESIEALSTPYVGIREPRRQKLAEIRGRIFPKLLESEEFISYKTFYTIHSERMYHLFLTIVNSDHNKFGELIHQLDSLSFERILNFRSFREGRTIFHEIVIRSRSHILRKIFQEVQKHHLSPDINILDERGYTPLDYSLRTGKTEESATQSYGPDVTVSDGSLIISPEIIAILCALGSHTYKVYVDKVPTWQEQLREQAYKIAEDMSRNQVETGVKFATALLHWIMPNPLTRVVNVINIGTLTYENFTRYMREQKAKSGVINPYKFRDPNNNNNIFHYIAIHNLQIALDYVIEYYHNLNRANKNGDTPLHLAISNYHSEMAVRLISHGANISLENARHERPIDLALERRMFDLAIYIMLLNDKTVGLRSQKSLLSMGYEKLSTMISSPKKQASFGISNYIIYLDNDQIKYCHPNGRNLLHYASHMTWFDYHKIEGRISYIHESCTQNLPFSRRDRNICKSYIFTLANKINELHLVISRLHYTPNEPHGVISATQDSILILRETILNFLQRFSRTPFLSFAFGNEWDQVLAEFLHFLSEKSLSEGDFLANLRHQTLELRKYILTLLTYLETGKEGYNPYEIILLQRFRLFCNLENLGLNCLHGDQHKVIPLHLAARDGNHHIIACIQKIDEQECLDRNGENVLFYAIRSLVNIDTTCTDSIKELKFIALYETICYLSRFPQLIKHKNKDKVSVLDLLEEKLQKRTPNSIEYLRLSVVKNHLLLILKFEKLRGHTVNDSLFADKPKPPIAAAAAAAIAPKPPVEAEKEVSEAEQQALLSSTLSAPAVISGARTLRLSGGSRNLSDSIIEDYQASR